MYWNADHAIYSALGVKDGKVYEALMRSTEHEPLNQREVVEGYQVRFCLFPVSLWVDITRVGVHQTNS